MLDSIVLDSSWINFSVKWQTDAGIRENLYQIHEQAMQTNMLSDK